MTCPCGQPRPRRALLCIDCKLRLQQRFIQAPGGPLFGAQDPPDDRPMGRRQVDMTIHRWRGR